MADIIKQEGTSDLMENIFSKLENQRNVMEEAYKKLVETLFSDEKLLMIARLRNDMDEHIIRNIIVDDFYFKYYSMIDFKIKLKKVDDSPFIESCIINEKLINKKELNKKYRNLIDDLLKISISYKGEGRKEILEILKKGAEDIQREKERMINPNKPI